MAQFGRALGLGPSGRVFESLQVDHAPVPQRLVGSADNRVIVVRFYSGAPNNSFRGMVTQLVECNTENVEVVSSILTHPTKYVLDVMVTCQSPKLIIEVRILEDVPC